MILTGGVLFPESLPLVFIISIAGIVVSASAIYFLPGVGGYDSLLEQEVSGANRPCENASHHAVCVLGCGGVVLLPFVPTDVICYAAGLLGMSYRRVIAALLLGEVPLVLGYLFLTQIALDLLG